MSDRLLAHLPDMTDDCGCSLLDGRCDTHAEMMREIRNVWENGNDAAFDVLWSLQDGYGIPGETPIQGIDWSGVRDSSCEAIEAMYRAIHA